MPLSFASTPGLERSCFDWIDKKVNYSRWLTLDSITTQPVERYGYNGIYGSSNPLRSSAGSTRAPWKPMGAQGFALPPPTLITSDGGGSFSYHGQSPPPPYRAPGIISGSHAHATPQHLASQFCPGSSSPSSRASGGSLALQAKLQRQAVPSGRAYGGGGGSPGRLSHQSQQLQQWASSGAPIGRSSSGMPGSPLIGARRYQERLN